MGMSRRVLIIASSAAILLVAVAAIWLATRTFAPRAAVTATANGGAAAPAPKVVRTDPDGTRLLAVGELRLDRVPDAAGGLAMKGQTRGGVVFSGDGLSAAQYVEGPDGARNQYVPVVWSVAPGAPPVTAHPPVKSVENPRLYQTFIFSPDGTRLGYLGDGQIWVNGRAVATGAAAVISDGVDHFAWLELFAPPGKSGRRRWVVDGVPHDGYYQDVKGGAFSADGSTFAYAASIYDGGREPWTLVVNGKPAFAEPPPGRAHRVMDPPILSADGRHVAGLVVSAEDLQTEALVTDAGVGPFWPHVQESSFRWLADGRPCYLARVPATKTGRLPLALIADGQPIAGPHLVIDPDSIRLGPAGKHVAYLIDEFNDSGMRTSEGALVLDGQVVPSPGKPTLFDFGPDGRLAVLQPLPLSARPRPDVTREVTVGAAHDPPLANAARFRWSPDGAHYAYAATMENRRTQVRIDGRPVLGDAFGSTEIVRLKWLDAGTLRVVAKEPFDGPAHVYDVKLPGA